MAIGSTMVLKNPKPHENGEIWIIWRRKETKNKEFLPICNIRGNVKVVEQ